ncbi:MAG: glycosyltransferase family 4 protein [Acidobacteria bacterium]|nr:glycosyltransferase family 4 protein [Acidobacteriota bacterium]
MNGDSNDIKASDKAKQRLWIVCELYYPEENATGHYMTQTAEGLAPHFDVKFICGQPNYASKGKKGPSHEIRNGVEIFRCWGTRLDKNVLAFRLINMLTLGMTMFVRSFIKFRRGDKVLAVTAPPSLPYQTGFAALMKGAGYYLLLHDLYPDILVAVSGAKRSSLLVRAIEVANRWLYKHTAKIIAVGRDMKELLQAKTSGLDVPIAVIPNWADMANIEPRPRDENELLDELGIKEKFVFLYAGNIGHPTDIESIVSAAKMLKKEPIHFIFVGSGAKLPWLRNEVTSLGLENISILGQLPREQQRIFLNAGDVAIISLVKGMWGTAMPSRTYNTLATGMPILALTENGSELARVIDEEDVGWHIPPGQPEALVEIIREISARRGDLDEMRKRARAAAIEKYTPEVAIGSYLRELS